MEHRPRKKHQKFNSDTNAGNEVYLKEILFEKITKEVGALFLQKKENGKDEQREMKNVKAGSPSNGPLKHGSFTKENRHLLR